MSNGILSLLGWSFLPSFVTGWTQTIYYGIMIRAGDPKPQPGSVRWAEHRRRINIAVVALYLAYTIYEANYQLRRDGSFYSDLGVPPTASEREIKSRFRRLAALYHPDKASGGDAAAANDFFVHLKQASETLTDPAKRFAYDRFGPDVVDWTKCVTVRDFVVRGIQNVAPYYCIAALAMYVVGLFGYLDWGRYERWLIMLLFFLFECHTITRQQFPIVLTHLVNPLLMRFSDGAPYLPFQLISLGRQLAVTIYIAFSQIGPLFFADTSNGFVDTSQKTDNQEKLVRQNLDRLDALAQGLNADATRLIEMELTPFAGDEPVLRGLRAKIQDWLVQNTIRSDPMVRDALGTSFKKRRVDAPAGARGTK